VQDQRSAGGSSPPEPPEPEDSAAVVLDILIGQHPSLLHVDELLLMYARGSIQHDRARLLVEDALSELLASGLVHRVERFVFASRAALRAQALALQPAEKADRLDTAGAR
jgi:hypothetical protein